MPGFPRLYAAASLKQGATERQISEATGGFPRLYAAASLKPYHFGYGGRYRPLFSAALCRGLIEAPPGRTGGPCPCPGFPRLYAAASLKLAGRAQPTLVLGGVFRGFMPRPH